MTTYFKHDSKNRRTTIQYIILISSALCFSLDIYGVVTKN
jgi:hypothetical protein